MAQRVFGVLRKEDCPGGNTAINDAVREVKNGSQEVFVPLVHLPREATVEKAVLKVLRRRRCNCDVVAQHLYL